MFAMREEEGLILVTVLFFFIVIIKMALNYAHRANRLKTIDKVVAAGNIDENTRRSILDALAEDARRQGELWQQIVRNAPRIARGILFVCGWLTLVIGGGCWGAMALFGNASPYDIQGAMIATFIGFGLVSLPLAMRELDGRRAEARP